jgi:hypothetical protein
MADRYWVGGSGNWNNSSTSNWSTSSGGSPGASAPTLSDDVIFDSNSGSGTVSLTYANKALCNNFTIQANTNLDFAGSLTIIDNSYNAIVSGNTTILDSNVTFDKVAIGLYSDGAGNDWHLSSVGEMPGIYATDFADGPTQGNDNTIFIDSTMNFSNNAVVELYARSINSILINNSNDYDFVFTNGRLILQDISGSLGNITLTFTGDKICEFSYYPQNNTTLCSDVDIVSTCAETRLYKQGDVAPISSYTGSRSYGKHSFSGISEISGNFSVTGPASVLIGEYTTIQEKR